MKVEPKESYNLIKYKYERGAYTLEKMVKFVEEGKITEKEFHQITSYNYQGIKKIGGIPKCFPPKLNQS